MMHNGWNRRWEWVEDSRLIVCAQRGDRDAFGEVYRRYKRALLALARARLSDPLTAEDVVQDAFIKAFQSLRRIDPRRPLGPWLATITANLVIDTHRLRQLIPSPEPFSIRDDVDATAETVLAAEGVRLLRRAIDALPSRQRRIFMASVFQHASLAEIARMENISEASAKSIVYRARQAVRRHMRRLATVLVALRLVELRNRARRAAASLERMAPIADWRVAAGCWCLAVVIAILPVTLHAPAQRATYPQSQWGAQDTTTPQRPASGHPPPSQPPVRMTAKTGPTHNANAEPSSGNFRVEAVSPVGGIKQSVEVCNDVLPKDGPVRFVC